MSVARLPSLYLITDADRIGEDIVVSTAVAAARGGLRMIVVREPLWTAARAGALAERLRDAIETHIDVLLACRGGDMGRERCEIVERLDLCGVHVGGGDVSLVDRAREVIRGDRVVGYSAHGIEEIVQAFERRASYVSFSPVFRPLSKGFDMTPVGVDGLRVACGKASGPVYALGGVTEDEVFALRDAGAAGVAVISSLSNAADPAAVARRLAAPWDLGAADRSGCSTR